MANQEFAVYSKTTLACIESSQGRAPLSIKCAFRHRRSYTKLVPLYYDKTFLIHTQLLKIITPIKRKRDKDTIQINLEDAKMLTYLTIIVDWLCLHDSHMLLVGLLAFAISDVWTLWSSHAKIWKKHFAKKAPQDDICKELAVAFLVDYIDKFEIRGPSHDFDSCLSTCVGWASDIILGMKTQNEECTNEVSDFIYMCGTSIGVSTKIKKLHINTAQKMYESVCQRQQDKKESFLPQKLMEAVYEMTTMISYLDGAMGRLVLKNTST